MRHLRLVVGRARTSQAIRCEGDDQGEGVCLVHQRDDRFRVECRQLLRKQEDGCKCSAGKGSRSDVTRTDTRSFALQALTMTVAANCKQVLTIAIAVFLFNLHINFTNGIGIVLTLIGGVSTVFFCFSTYFR